MDNKFERVDYDDDPERCQANDKSGQCRYRAIIGQNGTVARYCERHKSGKNMDNMQCKATSMDPIRNYRFSAQFQPRIDEFSNSEKIKNLREEIALVRMVLESIVNRCNDQYDLILEADRIAKLVDQLNKLVQSCHKIEESTGQLLDKTVVISIGSMVVAILEKHVPDKSILDVVGAEIYEAIEKSSRREVENGFVSR